MTVVSPQIHPVDYHVGQKVRMRRKSLNLSQEGLAEACDVSFQQIQKYERGANRISASMLVQISNRLGVPPSYFLDDAPGAAAATPVKDEWAEAMALLSDTPGALEVLRAYAELSAALRMSLQDVVRAMAQPKATLVRRVA